VIGERYHVQEALGQGGAAQIYRVVDAASGNALALKQLHADATDKLAELFEREYQTLASFDHPHTVRVFEFGHEPSGPFYTMELLAGHDLGGSGPLPWRKACRYLADATQALGVLHARGLIHRDVSPRNLWLTPEDRVKLIDFGALVRFGAAQHVIGTPPCVPPEALDRRGLDQRADLYGLGAVAYYLLTGQHAYPARELSDLQAHWQLTPALPSHVVARLGCADLEPVPRELDTLVLSLLQPNPQARPSSSTEVLDRLDSLLGQAQHSDTDAALARLTNTAFAGRASELRRLRRQLDLTLSGRGQVAVVEGPSGAGTTRLSSELAQHARVERATVVEVDAAREPGSYGLAAALVLALLDALPERALEAAAEQRSVLAHLPRLRERLGAQPAQFPPVAGEQRVRVQQAFASFFCAVARDTPVVVLVDSLDRADEESAACLHRLALECRETRLLLACCAQREAGSEPRVVERALHKLAQVASLGPLNELEHTALLSSVFGGAEHLTRLAARLYRAARGNPGQTLALCRQLVQRGTITFVNGTWVLPRELSDAELSETLEATQRTRLAGLPAAARELLGMLSVHKGALSQELIQQLAGPQLAGQLPELLARELLVASGPSLVFVHEQLRLGCARELTPEAAQRARKRLAEHMLSLPHAGSVEQAEAGLHLLACGDERGAAVIVAAAKSCVLQEVDRLISVAPVFEAALEQFRARGRSLSEQVVLLAALARAGYEVDPRYSWQYGEQAIQALEEVCGVARARRWRRYLGFRLSVLCSVAWAGIELFRQRDNPCVPGLEHAIQLLVVAVFASAATRTTFFDPDGASRCAEALQPLTALGRNTVVAFMYEYACVLADTGRDNFPEVTLRWQKILARLASGKRLWGAPPELLTVTRGGALFALGGVAAHRDDDWALRAAEQLDGNGYALNQAYAAQIRAVYYGYHGMLAELEHSRERVEQLAIQNGTSWQVEVWVAGSMSALALLLHDAMTMKRAAEQMKRLSERAPALRVHARHMQGAYLLMRGRSAESLPWLEDCLHEAPCARIAWGRSHGVLARAYNQCKEHERARAACLRVLSCFSDAYFDFPPINMIVLTELALAEASLGDLLTARGRIDALLKRASEHDNPLTLGHLYETLVEIALIAEDPDDARAQYARMKDCYRSIASSSLVQRCDLLKNAIDTVAGDSPAGTLTGVPPAATTTGPLSSNVALLADQLLASRGRPFEERANTALRVLAASVGATRGALGLALSHQEIRVITTLDAKPVSPSLEAFMQKRLDDELSDPDTIVSGGRPPEQSRATTLQEDANVYAMAVLSYSGSAGGRLLGVAALGGERSAPSACPSELLRAVCDLLHDAQ
jgi:tetratricopeptide (TPR) repeat protein